MRLDYRGARHNTFPFLSTANSYAQERDAGRY